jgi:hypothetical protein
MKSLFALLAHAVTLLEALPGQIAAVVKENAATAAPVAQADLDKLHTRFDALEKHLVDLIGSPDAADAAKPAGWGGKTPPSSGSVNTPTPATPPNPPPAAA